MAVADLDLTVRAGEVVCLYGLMGAGRTELLETLAGRLPAQTGTVHVDGVDVTTASIADRIARGLALVPEDRQRDGLVQSMSVGDNLSLASIAKFRRGPFLAARREDDAVRRTIRDVTVKASGPGAAIGSLSGGNQQKVVIGKVLLTGPRVLLLDEPTRGIDVGAKADIFTLMAEQARSGLAVLFATSELGEALHAADRVLVLHRGRVVRDLDPRTTTKEDLMAASDDAAAPAARDTAAPAGTDHRTDGTTRAARGSRTEGGRA
jgi:erythritol transport system ATP-binding protein